MHNAAIRLLGLENQQITRQAEDMIFGQLRQVIASMRIEDINRDRDKFLEAIQKSLEPELKKIGLVLINVNITDITDESGYIEALGRKAASEAIQQADLLIALGMRFDDRVTGNLKTYALNAKKIHVDIDPTEINKNVQVDVALIGDLREVLAMHRVRPVSRHLEVETYTWDVLPADLKTGDITEYVVRELDWVKSQLV